MGPSTCVQPERETKSVFPSFKNAGHSAENKVAHILIKKARVKWRGEGMLGKCEIRGANWNQR